MKTKRITSIGLVVGLLLVLAGDALAFYNPQTGRWLNRDPKGEKGGINLYVFALNDAVRKFDPLGLDPTFIGCTDDQKAGLMSAIRTACDELQQKALSCCAGVPERQYHAIVGQCQRMNEMVIECSAADSEKCKEGNCARAQVSGTQMWMCPKAFTDE